MITALAAQWMPGVVAPDETVWCPGHMDVGGRASTAGSASATGT